jgi:MFS family permease
MPDEQPGSAKDRGPLLALLTANTISQVGNSMSTLAIPWFVLTTTGSATSTAVTVAAGTLPLLISGVFGGAIVDRLGYRASSIISDLASGITVTLIPILHLTGGIGMGQLLALVFLGALLDAPGDSARLSLYPDLVERAGMTLERANTGYATTARLASMLAAPAGGILIAAFGATNLLFIDSATFGLSALLVAMRVPAMARPTAEHAHRGLRRYAAEIREGFAFFHRDGILFGTMTGLIVGALLADPIYGVILPVYVQERYGSAVNLGLIFGALAVGSLGGNALYAAFGRRLPRRTWLLGGCLVRGLAFTVLIVVPPWWVIALAIFIGAVALEPVNPLHLTIFQERVPEGMRGRVFGAMSAIRALTYPAGILTYGWLLGATSVSTTLALFVVVNLAYPIWLWWLPALRHLDTAPEGREPHAAGPLTG